MEMNTKESMEKAVGASVDCERVSFILCHC